MSTVKRHPHVVLTPRQAKAYKDYQAIQKNLASSSLDATQRVSNQMLQIQNLKHIINHRLSAGQKLDTFQSNWFDTLVKRLGGKTYDVSRQTAKMLTHFKRKQNHLMRDVQGTLQKDINNYPNTTIRELDLLSNRFNQLSENYSYISF
jgi:hypothetical protein